MELDESKRLLSQVRRWFDEPRQVAHYVQGSDAGPTAAEAALLSSLPPAPASVIDLGCGAGRIALSLTERHYRVTGVDVSAAMVAAAQDAAVRKSSSARFLTVDSVELPFAMNTFGAALAIKTYCYIPSARRRIAYLGEVARVLRPGAVLLLTSYVVPTEADAVDALAGDDLHRQAAAGFSTLEPLDTFVEGRGFVRWFTREGLLAELSTSDLAVEQVQGEASTLQVMVTLRKR